MWLKQCAFVLKLVLRRSGSCKYVGLSEYQKRHQQQFSQTNSWLTNFAMAEVVFKMQKLKCTSLHIFEMIHVGVDSWDRPQQTKVTLSSRNGCMDGMSVWRRSTETDYGVFTNMRPCFIHYHFKIRIECNDDHETHMHFIGKIGLHFFKEPTHNGTKCSRNILLPHAGVHTVISTFNSESSWAFYLLFPESSIMEIIANLLVLETKKTHFLFTITKLHF